MPYRFIRKCAHVDRKRLFTKSSIFRLCPARIHIQPSFTQQKTETFFRDAGVSIYSTGHAFFKCKAYAIRHDLTSPGVPVLNGPCPQGDRKYCKTQGTTSVAFPALLRNIDIEPARIGIKEVEAGSFSAPAVACLKPL